MISKRRLTATHLQELEELKQKCTLILEYFNRTGSLGDLAAQTQAAINETYVSQNLKGLRMVYGDFKEWIRELPQDERDNLTEMLQMATGADLRQDEAADLQAVRDIEARRRIRNEREYRLVQARIEQIYEDPSQAAEVERLNALLSAY